MKEARHQLVVLTRAKPGREADLHRWYDDHHLTEICAIPGVLSATRGEVEIVKGAAEGAEWHSLAIYELEAEDPVTILTEISRRRQAGELTWTDAVLGEHTFQVVGRTVTAVE